MSAVLPSLSCAPLYDIDNIACNGHGQCPVGYHCQQEGEAGTPAVSGQVGLCVLGEAEGSGQSAIVVSRIARPIESVNYLFAGALFTELASLDRIEEAVWEDVIGMGLLLEAESDGGVRHRSGGANQYPAATYDPDHSPQVAADDFSLYFDSIASLQIPVEAGSTEISPNQFPTRTQRCGIGGQLGVRESPQQILVPGEIWWASRGFSQNDSVGVTGPAMPKMPAPASALLVAGELLIPWGSDLQFTDGSVDPVAGTRDVFLTVVNEGFGGVNNPDCPESGNNCSASSCPLCEDGQDNDGDGRIDCEDPDCAVFYKDDPESCVSDEPQGQPADIAAYSVEEDGTLWRPWDQLPDSIQNGDQQKLMLAWGRTRRSRVYEPEHGAESTVLASTTWFSADGRVLDPGQYAVRVVARSGEPDSQQVELQRHPPGDDWPAGGLYEVTIHDRLVGDAAHGAAIHQDSGSGEPQELEVDASSGRLSGEVDLRALCRGVASIKVTEVGGSQPGDEEGDCPGCGIGTFDYRRPISVCDRQVGDQLVAYEGGPEGQPFQPSQVACASFPRANEEDGDGDGYGDNDCDDEDPGVHPGAEEVCDDGVDNDCNGLMDADDGFCTAGGGESEAVPSGIHEYTFFASAGVRYTFEVLAEQLTGESDSDIRLLLRRNEDNHPITHHDGVDKSAGGDDYCGSDPRLVWECQESTQYTLAVQRYTVADVRYQLVTDIR